MICGSKPETLNPNALRFWGRGLLHAVKDFRTYEAQATSFVLEASLESPEHKSSSYLFIF